MPMPFLSRSSTHRLIATSMALAISLAAISGAVVAQDDATSAPTVGSITVYTSVTQDTVDAVLAALAESQPGLNVEVFRAPTGELDARIATELRTGGIAADLLWMTDPLSVQRYEADGLLLPLEGDAFDAIPAEYQGETFVGTRLLNLVIVAGQDIDPKPTSWADLADPAFADNIVMPDPGFAGSAFAALGYLATDADLGPDFYQRLKDNGAVQVSSPGEVLNGVAEGNYAAGITLDKVVRAAADKGSPIELVWPEPGAIALFSPAAVVASSDDPQGARAFQEFLISPEGQAAIATTGWQPVRGDVEWPYVGAVVTPDWNQLYGSQQQLLEDYYAIFGD
jgi:iron(III) transport system substrate-binding protein